MFVKIWRIKSTEQKTQEDNVIFLENKMNEYLHVSKRQKKILQEEEACSLLEGWGSGIW